MSDLEKLRSKTRTAIKSEGLVRFAEIVGIGPATLQRFAHGAGRSHKGTEALVEAGLRKLEEPGRKSLPPARAKILAPRPRTTTTSAVAVATDIAREIAALRPSRKAAKKKGPAR
jgi:hypothetical protein